MKSDSSYLETQNNFNVKNFPMAHGLQTLFSLIYQYKHTSKIICCHLLQAIMVKFKAYYNTVLDTQETRFKLSLVKVRILNFLTV